MLCQIILTAIAISYVICVLLLSGLQKEDLDENTLVKLQRHNVNIYDMNNESLRQECLSKSYLDSGKDAKTYEVTGDPNDTSKTSTTKQNELSTKLSFSDNLNVDRQKSKIVTPKIYFVDQTNLRNLIDETKVETVANTNQDSNDKVNVDVTESRPDNINISVKENKDQQIEYIKNQPSLDSVMQFWDKLTNKHSIKALTANPTTHASPPREIKTKIITSTKANLANAQSLEYVSKMIAEYLRTQTIPTTTEASKSRANDMDIVSRTIKEFLDKNSKTNSITVPKYFENTFSKDLKELSDLTEIGKIFEDNNKEEERTDKVLHMQQKEINEDNQDKAKKFSSRMKVSPQTLDSKSVKEMQALKYLDNMLKVNNQINLNGPFSMEVSTLDSTNNNKGYEKLNEQKIFHDYYTKSSNYNNNVSGMVQSNNFVKDDVIKEIAEKVKEIVMRDIRKEIPTTERVTSCLTTRIPASTTANPTTTLKEASQTSVIQTLMELLKKLNTIKEVTTTTTEMPMTETLNVEKSTSRNLPLDIMYPPVMGGFNPYILKTPVAKVKQFEVNPFNQNLVPIPLGPLLHSPLHRPTYMPPTNLYQKSEYKAPPLTIQTNSAEIPPLVIQVSKPMKVMNQHIILTTQNPFRKERDEKLHRENKQRLNFNYAEPFHVSSERNPVDNPTYADLTKKLRIAENVKKEFRESYKDKIEKIKERIEHNRDKATELRHPIESDRGIGLDKLKHHISPSLDLNHYGGQVETWNRHDPSNRQLDPNWPVNSHHRQILNQPAGINHDENLNRPADSNYRDILTREFLGRLVDSNHRDVISQLVEPSPDIRRPIDLDRQSRNHLSDAYERFEHERSHPRYKATKFHEKLEQIENMPLSNYESHSRSTTQSYCDTVASRQQMPLNKVKEHQRFDDSHFKNFLKSQQKVTDMLERILAAKSKARKDSAETK